MEIKLNNEGILDQEWKSAVEQTQEAIESYAHDIDQLTLELARIYNANRMDPDLVNNMIVTIDAARIPDEENGTLFMGRVIEAAKEIREEGEQLSAAA